MGSVRDMGASVLLLAVVAAWCSGQSRHAAAADRAQKGAKSVEVEANRLEFARQRAIAALEGVGALVDRSGAENARAWRAWLDWDALRAELRSASPDWANLLRIERRLRQDIPGLERHEFIRLRSELRALAANAELAATPESTDLYALRRESAERLLALLGEQPLHADADDAAALVDWLSHVSEEGERLAHDAQRRYGHANASFRVSRRFLDYLASRAITEAQPFQAFAMGAHTSGVAITRAEVGVQFLPNASEAAVNLTIRGTVAMPENTSSRRRVSVFSSSNVAISAAKSVIVDDEGLRFSPATASARANVSIEGVSAGSRFVERLAWRRAESMRPQAASDTAGRVESEIEARADELSREVLVEAHRVFCEQIRAPLVRLDALPEQFEFSTTAEHLQIVMSKRRFAQLASAIASPAYREGDDVAFRVHESFLNNLAASLLPGTTVKDRHWLEMLALMTGSKPRALWVHDRAAAWSVTFAEHLPVSTRMADGAVHVVLRFDAARRGEDVWVTPMAVEATLEPRLTRDGPALFRRGALAVHVAADGASEAAAANELQRFLERKFAAIFPSELHFDGLVAPEGGSLGKLRSLGAREFYCERGWLVLGYELDLGGEVLLAGESESANAGSN